MHTGTDFPECVLCHALQAKQNFGICVSGGGVRATTLALRSGTGTTADRCPAVAVHARGGGTPGGSDDGAGRGTHADAPALASFVHFPPAHPTYD